MKMRIRLASQRLKYFFYQRIILSINPKENAKRNRILERSILLSL